MASMMACILRTQEGYIELLGLNLLHVVLSNCKDCRVYLSVVRLVLSSPPFLFCDILFTLFYSPIFYFSSDFNI